MAYRLTLTESDVQTIAFVGWRYGWSDSLSRLSEGENELAEHEAWEIAEAIDGDEEGGHHPFPMLDPRCELYSKLSAFRESIV